MGPGVRPEIVTEKASKRTATRTLLAAGLLDNRKRYTFGQSQAEAQGLAGQPHQRDRGPERVRDARTRYPLPARLSA